MIFTEEERAKFGLPGEQDVAVLVEKYMESDTIRCGVYESGTDSPGVPEVDCLCLIAVGVCNQTQPVPASC